MHRIARIAAVMTAFFIAGLGQAESQDRRDRRASEEAVTILTTGITDADHRMSLAINELATVVTARSKVRVLPMAGRGGVENARDLLYQRGVDFAVLNSDVLTFLELTSQYPTASRRIRYVSQLLDQKFYLLVRRSISRIEDLAGRKVAALGRDAGGHLTAQTIFGLLHLSVKLESLADVEPFNDALVAGFDAVVLMGDEASRLGRSGGGLSDFRVLPVHLTPSLQKAYTGAVIQVGELAGLGPREQTETIAVSTLLAVFDWRSENARYSKIGRFIGGLFESLPMLRSGPSASLWAQTNILAKPAGWTRHQLAQPERVLSNAQLTILSQVALPVLPPASPTTAVASSPTSSAAPIRILAKHRLPLADETRPNGGVAVDLVTRGLASATASTSSPATNNPSVVLSWANQSVEPLRALIEDRSVDIVLPVDATDCDRPNDLSKSSAILCDQAIYSSPILTVVVGLFTLADSEFKFVNDQSVVGRTLCIADDRDTTELNANGRNWLTTKSVTVIRRRSTLECAGAVQSKDADAFIADDLEVRAVLGRLGLSRAFRMEERPLATHGVHAVVAKSNPRAVELIAQINSGLVELKRTDAYSSVFPQHLEFLWSGQSTGAALR